MRTCVCVLVKLKKKTPKPRSTIIPPRVSLLGMMCVSSLHHQNLYYRTTTSDCFLLALVILARNAMIFLVFRKKRCQCGRSVVVVLSSIIPKNVVTIWDGHGRHRRQAFQNLSKHEFGYRLIDIFDTKIGKGIILGSEIIFWKSNMQSSGFFLWVGNVDVRFCHFTVSGGVVRQSKTPSVHGKLTRVNIPRPRLGR